MSIRTTCQAIFASQGRLLSAGRSSWSVQLTTKRWGSVRLIALEDLPHARGYKGDVLTVKAGYARNFLIPHKKAVYATPQNFVKLGMVDPDYETEEQRLARLQRESSLDKKAEQHLKEADKLKRYLRNKVVRVFCVCVAQNMNILESPRKQTARVWLHCSDGSVVCFLSCCYHIGIENVGFFYKIIIIYS